MTTTTLSAVKPDQPLIVSQLQALLSTKTAWRDLYLSGTGQTLIEMVAAIGALDQYAIEQAYRQSFLDTSLTDSAVFAIARMLGVRIPRRNPAVMSVTLTRVDTSVALTIPAYSVFTCGSVTLFNREALTFALGAATIVGTLMEGEIRTFSLAGQGTNFQMFRSPETGFEVSDQDVQVKVNNNEVPVVQNGIWNYTGSMPAVQDSTTKDGELLLTFGNSLYGYRPVNGVQIDILYAVTKGSGADDSNLATQPVSYSGDPDITGVVNAGGLANGGNALSASTMRAVSPLMFSSQGNKATTRSEFSALPLTYPGVMDALVVGQREVAPTDVRYMNLVRVSLLTSSPMTDAFWSAFSSWYTRRIMYPVRIYRQDPIPMAVSVSLNVYCSSTADLPTVKAKVIAAVTELFTPRAGYIGFNIYRSDIYDAVRNCDPTVQFTEMASPSLDVIVDAKGPRNLFVTEMNDTAGGLFPGGSGILTAGDYTYGVSTVNSVGESLVSNVGSVQRTTTGVNRVSWNRVLGAVSYKVYGRTPFNRGYLGTVTDTGAGSYAFYDLGTITPVGGLPALDTSGVHYATMSSLVVNVYYNNRGR